jgi:hypothetical protein
MTYNFMCMLHDYLCISFYSLNGEKNERNKLLKGIKGMEKLGEG